MAESFDPPTIKVGHADYKFVWMQSNTARGKRVTGETSYSEQLISIADDLSPQQRAEITLHELLHCLFYHWQIVMSHEQEERTISALAMGLAAVIRDNPGFIDLIQRELR